MWSGRVAADQLRAGRPVVADAVNNVMAARQGWVILARDCAVPLRFVQVVCSDKSEHRRRVQTRTAEMPGYDVPTWQQVQHRPWVSVSKLYGTLLPLYLSARGAGPGGSSPSGVVAGAELGGTVGGA